jgi:hypothetical protein
MTLFDILRCITEKKPLDFEDYETEKLYDIFVVNSFLSSVDEFNVILAEIEHLPLTKKSHFEYLSMNIPKGKYRFSNPFVKKPSVEEQKNEMLFYRHFQTGSKDLKDILTSMTENEKMELVTAYRTDGK